ncbi:MAG: type II toxin-antitoxin system VapC family toxin [Gemmatimonadetes bacterium]|nr:type II toxin-antitoxin system VapC family toxin [Gemmatimonadota bacterium]
MILLDVNVLVYAVRKDAERNADYREWLDLACAGSEPVAVAPESLGAVVRIVTHRKLWAEPITREQAFTFIRLLRATPALSLVHPGDTHWEIFENLCRAADARGNLVTDAWLAALAIENHATLITTDRDFARFPGLKWKHPLQKKSS